MRRAVTIICLLAATPVAAQQQGAPSTASSQPTGRAADAGNGEIGQRQTRQEAAPNIDALERVETRIANRVQNRIRSRIDTSYDPQANAAEPFRAADAQARTGRPRRR